MAFKAQENAGRFVIGEVGGMVYWTSIAFDHQSGKLKNEVLMGMTDHQLKMLAYADGKGDVIALERYSKEGNEWNGKGVHRAMIILQFRRATAQAMAAAKAQEQGEMAKAAPEPFNGLSYEEVAAMP